MKKNSKILILIIGLTLIFIVGAGSVSAGWFGDDSTGEELSATTDYNFTYFGSENPAPKDGYDFAIQTDDGVFYIDNSLASKLSQYRKAAGPQLLLVRSLFLILY